jgi:hypothetical protein
LRKVCLIDEDGLFIEDVILSVDEPLSDDLIDIEVPEGFYHPRWNGEAWEEGLTPEEIEALQNQPTKPDDIEILKQENILLKAQNQALSDRADFQEELIAEIAMMVYP